MPNYLSIQTNLDKTVKRNNKFFLHTVTGEEGICKDFSYQLHVSSPERLSPSEIDDLIGQSLSVKIDFLGGKNKTSERFINGIAYELKELGMSHDPLLPEIWRYEIEISSWLRQLDSVKDSRIFQKADNTSVKIISEFLRELGMNDFKFDAKGKISKLQYSVMYDESISNYIKRLALEDGLFWYYEHSKSKHTLVFCDDSLQQPEISGIESGRLDKITSFCREDSHIPINKVGLGSYNYESPPVKHVQQAINNNGLINHYHYSDFFKSREEGEKRAEQYKQSTLSQVTRYFGQSSMRSLIAGYQFKLLSPVLPEYHNKKFLIKELKIKATREKYENEFVVLPGKDRYYDLNESKVTKPSIIHSQTAVVVGEKGDGEVPTTNKGRVRVRFHWDHHSPANAGNTSAYIRVSSPLAGSQRGTVFTPRIGEEVLISFEDGNPNKPLIIGSMYSHQSASPNMAEAGSLIDMIMDDVTNKPPQKSTALAQPFVGTIKSDGDANSNRVTFNESKGSEYFELNAKKDLNAEVGHDLNIDVDKDIYIFVNNDESIDIINNSTTKAGGSIINGTLGPIRETAGKDKSNMALGGIFNIAGAAMSNKAGATMTNTAILSVDNTSGGVLAQVAGVILANTCAGGISSSSEMISQKGDMVVLNISLAHIINNAAKEIKTKTLLQKSTVDEKSITDTGDYKIKSIMPKIN